jgi:hypothetical protein
MSARETASVAADVTPEDLNFPPQKKASDSAGFLFFDDPEDIKNRYFLKPAKGTTSAYKSVNSIEESRQFN